MIRSKTRSESFDNKQKSNFFSRTLSASKLCRRDVIETQIDANALQSVDKKKPSSSKNRADRIVTMQQQMGEMEEELIRSKEKLDDEKCQILGQLREVNRALSLAHNKDYELTTELQSLQESLKEKDKKIDYLESELQKARELDAQKNAYLDRLNNELRDIQEREVQAAAWLQDSQKRIQELEDEMGRRKELESRLADNLVSRAKQLDMTIFHLEESKIEMIGLHEKIESLEQENFGARNCSQENTLVREQALSHECRLAVEAEEKTRKAMEDLALALSEVATESNQAKEKLNNTQIELDRIKAEAEQLKKMIRGSQQESELHKNTAKRLRMEAEETLLALNEKEMGFVSCLKLAEEEKALAQSKSLRLSESLKEAEKMTRAARDETNKLRDILKQAVNEANAAKAASGIARDENSLLKDSLSEKEERLQFLTTENKRLTLSEAASTENMKQLKILLSKCSAVDFKNEVYDEDFEEENDDKMVNKSFNFNIEDLRFMNDPEDMVFDEDPAKTETLKGSIFDANAESPRSEPRTPRTARQRGHLEDGRRMEDSDSDLDSDRGSHRRTKTMFQRVGDLLLIRRIHHRKEPPGIEHTVTTSTHPDLN